MKKLYKISFLFVLLAFGSCSPEQDDLFDETAAERIDAAIKEDLTVLRGATNGWMMEYYPSKSKLYGGYTMLVSFGEDGRASVSCDLFAHDKVTKSEYEVKQSTGPILTFSTYNDIFHFFSEPSNFLGIGEEGAGMEGDYEFLILSCTPEQVVLKGKKTETKMIMTPMPENKTWAQYLEEVKGTTSKAYPAAYDVQVGGNTEYTVTQEYHMFVLTNKDGTQRRLPFVYTAEGIKFYEPIAIGNQEVQQLAWDNAAMAYTHNNISIKAQALPEGYKRYDDFIGKYQFIYYGTEVVTLREELFNNSFIMEGFPIDIRVLYKAGKGVIGIETQPLGGDVYLCPWALDGGGSLVKMTGAGVIGVNGVGGDGKSVILFEDNGVWGKTDSFIAYDLTKGVDIFQIPYVLGMIKQ